MQYLNDTNGDGEIDGNDNGVIFRMPFRDDSSTGGRARPEQLTSAAWNCVYPTPSPTRLLLTCTGIFAGSLRCAGDGHDSSRVGSTRLQAEANAARSIWTRLLLLGRISAEEISDNERWEVFRQMASDHLELGEFASALFYARQIQAEATAETTLVDWARGVELLALHRRDNQALSRGLRSAEFIRLAQKRLDELSQSPGSGFSREMRSAVAGISSSLSGEGRRVRANERISLESMNDPVSLMLVARLRNEMHRQNDQPEESLKMPDVVQPSRSLS